MELHFLSYIKVQFSLIKGIKTCLNSFSYPQTWGFRKGLILPHDFESFVNWKRMAGAEDTLSQADILRDGFYSLIALVNRKSGQLAITKTERLRHESNEKRHHNFLHWYEPKYWKVILGTAKHKYRILHFKFAPKYFGE